MKTISLPSTSTRKAVVSGVSHRASQLVGLYGLQMSSNSGKAALSLEYMTAHGTTLGLQRNN
jgi:hypothetical protein